MEALKKILRKLGAVSLALLMTNPAIAGPITYFHNDVSGSPMAATDESGNLLWKENYKPYGEKLNQSAPSSSNAIGYHGKPYDDVTGLSYMGARYYDPVLGRFMGIDPVDFQADNLHSFNRYTYANNNPYKYVDPDGYYAFLIAPIFAMFTALAASATVNSVLSGGSQSGSNELSSGGMSYPGSDIGNPTNWSLGKVHNDADDTKRFSEDGKKTLADTDTVPDQPAGKINVPSDKWWKDQGVDAHSEKAGMGDSKRNLGIDKKDNVWTVDRHGSGNPEFVGKLKDMRGD